jgi:hypothetical protein
MSHDVVIIGAGISGLSLARRLREAGIATLLLEKSRGVGGRCATRRVDGRPVDHGVSMLHGRSTAFAEALEDLGPCTPLRDWPFHVRGHGTPCQPQAYRPEGIRLAIREGISCFAKHLARGLEVELNTEVERVELAGDHFRISTSRGDHTAPTVVLTCPVDQTASFLEPLAPETAEVRALLQTLRTVHTVPCLTLLAGFAEAPPPRFPPASARRGEPPPFGDQRHLEACPVGGPGPRHPGPAGFLS